MMRQTCLNTLLIRPLINLSCSRHYYWKFKRMMVPPLQEPRESPYIVGPHLKPDYVPRSYITEPIIHRDSNDFDQHHYIPEKIESDESRKVELLLIEDVEGLGTAGQVVQVSFRYGASKLIPMKKAEYATDFALKWYKFGPKTTSSASSALSPRTARFLRSQVYKLPVVQTVVVQPWHISLALRLAGCICPIEAIDKDSIADFTDENGKPKVQCIVRINNHERVSVKFEYHKLVSDGEDEG